MSDFNDPNVTENDALPLERDHIAKAYLGLWGTPQTQERARRRIHWMAAQAKGHRILDVGCSEGILTILLAREGFEVKGLDINPDSIEFAKSLLDNEDLETKRRVDFECENVFTMNDPITLYDTVFAGEVIEHLSHPAMFLEKICSFLVPGGRLIITTPFGYFPSPDHKHTFTLSSAADLLKPLAHPKSFDVHEGYIRFVGETPISNLLPTESWDKFDAAFLLRKTEQATLDSQYQLRNEICERRKKAEQIHQSAKKDKETIAQLQSSLNSFSLVLENLHGDFSKVQSYPTQNNNAFDSSASGRNGSIDQKLNLNDKLSQIKLFFIGGLLKRIRRFNKITELFFNKFFSKSSLSCEITLIRTDGTNSIIPLSTCSPDFLKIVGNKVKFKVPKEESCYLVSKSDCNFNSVPTNDPLSLNSNTCYLITGNLGGNGNISIWLIEYDSKTRLQYHKVALNDSNHFSMVINTHSSLKKSCIAIRMNGTGILNLSDLVIEPFIESEKSENIKPDHLSTTQVVNVNNGVLSIKQRARKWLDNASQLLNKKNIYKTAMTNKEMLGVIKNGYRLPETNPKRHAKYFNKKVLLNFHSASSFDPSGYTVRSNAIMRALIGENIQITCCTRYGYPWDLRSHKNDDFVHQTLIEGFVMQHFQDSEKLFGHGDSRYIEAYANQLAKLAAQENTTVIHGASNYLNGLAAAIAARRIGVKSVYEMRGLWHLSRQSRDPSYATSDHYRYCEIMELAAAETCDGVVAISRPLRDWLVAKGIDEDKIQIVPNAAEINEKEKRDVEIPNELQWFRERFVVGYIGSLTRYDGVDTIIRAVAALKSEHPDILCIIVGDGRERKNLELLANELECDDAVVFTGRIPHQEVAPYYSVIDVFPLSRKPFEVCKLVPPLKPLEIMAKEKPVIVSDLPPLTDIVKDNETGLVCQPDDVQSLSESILKLYKNPDLRQDLALNGRMWVEKERTWRQNGELYKQLYNHLYNSDRETTQSE